MADRSILLAEASHDYFGGIEVKAAKRLVIRERIPHQVVNGRMLIRESDLKHWRESGTITPEAPSLKSMLSECVAEARRRLEARR